MTTQINQTTPIPTSEDLIKSLDKSLLYPKRILLNAKDFENPENLIDALSSINPHAIESPK